MNIKRHLLLFIFDALGIVAALYVAFSLLALRGAVIAKEEAIVQDTSIGFGFIGLIVVSIHFLVLLKNRFSLSSLVLNVISTGLFIFLSLLPFVTNYLVKDFLQDHSYRVCGFTEGSSGSSYPYWCSYNSSSK